MDEAEFCGRLGFINGGRLIALDTPAALKRATGSATLEAAFIHLAQSPSPASTIPH